MSVRRTLTKSQSGTSLPQVLQQQQLVRNLSSSKKTIASKPFKEKDTFICKFCGGKTCKHENWLTYPGSAIKGLNSDWITNTILATQRPSTRIMKEFNIIKQFKEKGINAIFNLQEPGEHPLCGDGIHPSSGFSYFPEEFYDNGIYFFNFGWKDMTATSTDVVLKILKQMSFSLTNGNKVAVHCHAGRGRTGLIIAAWLIYNDNMSAKEAIKLVRNRRQDAISKKSQEQLLYQFEKEVKESKMIFFSAPKYGLNEYLFHQKKLCALSSDSAERYVPKIVLVALERMEMLIKYDICRLEDILVSFFSLNERECFTEDWGPNQEKHLKSIKDKINTGIYELSDIEDPRYLAQIILDFLDGFSISAIDQTFIDAIDTQIHKTESKLTKDIKDQFFKVLDKKEFFLLECFARFFAGILALDDIGVDMLIAKAVLRVCISLLLQRKKHDKLFVKRSLVGDHNQDDQVTSLKIFLLKWIENFNEEFSENFKLRKSVLRINEKKIKEKLIRKGLKMNSYLSKVLDSNSKQNLDDEKTLTPRIRELDKIEENSLQNSQSSFKEGTQTSKKKAVQFEDPAITPHIKLNTDFDKSFKLPLDFIDQSASTRLSEQNSRGKEMENLLTPLPKSTRRNLTVQKFSGAETMPNKYSTKGILSFKDALIPFPNTNHLNRKSLLRVNNNEEIQENVSQLAKMNIKKHYDNFFGNNKEVSRASIREEESMEDIESNPSNTLLGIKKRDSMIDMLVKIEKMTAERQDILFQRLLEIQVKRNAETKV